MSSPPADVRMRGFAQRTDVASALAWVDAHSAPLPADAVAVEDAAGRVLAADLVAPIAVPEFDRAAMDGFALRAAATAGASEARPIEFALAGLAFPGRPFEGELPAGAAVRIMTGAPLPRGADAVVAAEQAREHAGRVAVAVEVTPGRHVGRTGEDIAARAVALPAGRRLRPQDAGLAASVGLAQLAVVRRPRVRLIVTGSELKAPGAPKSRWEIFDANSATLRGLLQRDGAIVESQRRLGDDPRAIADALAAPGADVLLVSGGSSIGTEDHAPRLVAQLGELAIHGVAMRPAAPTGMGRVEGALVLLLPGNPVACLCAYDFFAGRAIRRLGGRGSDWPYRVQRLPAAEAFVSQRGRTDYFRVAVGEGGAVPLALKGASMLSSTTRADGFVVVPAESEGVAAGDELTVYFYD